MSVHQVQYGSPVKFYNRHNKTYYLASQDVVERFLQETDRHQGMPFTIHNVVAWLDKFYLFNKHDKRYHLKAEPYSNRMLVTRELKPFNLSLLMTYQELLEGSF